MAIKVTVIADGKEVGTAQAENRWVLPDVIAQATRTCDQDPNLTFVKEEKVQDSGGNLVEVRVLYQRKGK